MREERLARYSLKELIGSYAVCSTHQDPRSRVLGGDYPVRIKLDYVTVIHILIKKLRFSLERNGEYQHYTEVTEGSHGKLSVHHLS